MTTFMETPVASGVAPDRARSWLLVPATKPDTFDAAVASGVDAVILDIEDAVAPAKKPAARETVVRWLSEGNSAWVRVNDATTPYWADDLAALSGLPGLVGVMLAKTESGGQVEATAARLADGTPILALVESAAGLEAATEIARADSTFRLAFGSGDFRRDTGMSDDPLALAMLIDVFSERGYHAVVDLHRIEVPESVDLKTGKICCRVKRNNMN